MAGMPMEYPQEMGAAPVTVRVQVCGRQEDTCVAQLSVRELLRAVERRFEVRPPFLLMDPVGQPLIDDAALAACTAKGHTVVVKLTEGVLHDANRRVDQLRHLQWGYLGDQLVGLKHELKQQQTELRACQAALLQEQIAHEQSHRELKQRLDEMQEWHTPQLPATAQASKAPSPGWLNDSTRAPSEELAEVKVAQAACDAAVGELRRQLEDCWQLARRNGGHTEVDCSFSQALEVAVAAERKARMQEIGELAQRLPQEEQPCCGETRVQFATRKDVAQIVKQFAGDVDMVQADLSKVRADVSKGVDILKDALLADMGRTQADIGVDIAAVRAEVASCQAEASHARRLAERLQDLAVGQSAS